MGHPYVCLTCRLQSVLRRQVQTAHQQRKWLSRTAWRGQDPIERAFAAGPLNRTSTVKAHSARSQDHSRRGRYSGKPLDPQEILYELEGSSTASRQQYQNNTAERTTTRNISSETEIFSPGNRSRRSNGAVSERPPDIPWDLWHDYQLFCHASKPLDGEKYSNREVARILVKLAKNRQGSQGLRAVARLKTFHARCHFFMREVCDEWTKDIGTGGSAVTSNPRPTEALSAFIACAPENRAIYPIALWRTASGLAELQSLNLDGLQGRLLEGIHELMMLWNFCMRNKLSRLSGGAPDMPVSMDWSFLHNLPVFAETIQQERQVHGEKRLPFASALNMLVPEKNLTREQALKWKSEGLELHDYPSAALVTLDLLQRMNESTGGADMTKKFEPWMKVVEMMISNAGDNRIPFAMAQKLETPNMKEYYKDVVERFRLQQSAFELADESQHSPPEQLDTDVARPTGAAPLAESMSHGRLQMPSVIQEQSVDTSSPLYRFVGTCIKRLGRAVEQEDRVAAERVRTDVQKFKTEHPLLQLPVELYENFLYAFLSLRSPNSTISVWDDMIKSGNQPRTKTYTIMMRGSQNARDHNALEGLWQRMRNSGLKPDRYAWATRIFGLLKSRAHVDLGLNAMNEMGQEWIAAARVASGKGSVSKGKRREKESAPIPMSELLSKFEDVDDVPRPDVAIMNSAISALAGRDNSLVPQVLSWGRSFRIEPDRVTYNVLINISMRHGMPEEALTMLRRMNEKGVEANSTTWTVLLAAMFEGPLMDDLSSEEVEERILDFMKSIDNMDGKGLDDKSYALIIDRLLKVYDRPLGAQKVLEHMAARNMKPNTHLYTILMSYYFAQSPPDFDAIENLWNRLESANSGYGTALDSVFYDRMVEGYAEHYSSVGTKPMLRFIEKMEAQGKRPSFKALEVAARALAETGEWNRLEGIVEKARMEDVSGSEAERQFGRKDFWNFLRSTGHRPKSDVMKTAAGL